MSNLSTDPQSIRITGRPDPELGICTFHISESLYQGSYHCRSSEEAQGSPLLEKLLAKPAIAQVLVQGNKLTVQKVGDEEWSTLGKEVASVVRESLSDDQPAIAIRETKEPEPNTSQIVSKTDLDHPLAQAVQDLLDQEINPSLASHGGEVKLIAIQEQKAVLEFSGGCQGCSMASQTIKQGIEVALKKKVPGVVGVIDVTDHTQGINPYYS